MCCIFITNSKFYFFGEKILTLAFVDLFIKYLSSASFVSTRSKYWHFLLPKYFGLFRHLEYVTLIVYKTEPVRTPSKIKYRIRIIMA